jgi:hypothetical protein
MPYDKCKADEMAYNLPLAAKVAEGFATAVRPVLEALAEELTAAFDAG